jgi:hypothetical protein
MQFQLTAEVTATLIYTKTLSVATFAHKNNSADFHLEALRFGFARDAGLRFAVAIAGIAASWAAL